jgi:hypothetical protein
MFQKPFNVKAIKSAVAVEETSVATTLFAYPTNKNLLA